MDCMGYIYNFPGTTLQTDCSLVCVYNIPAIKSLVLMTVANYQKTMVVYHNQTMEYQKKLMKLICCIPGSGGKSFPCTLED